MFALLFLGVWVDCLLDFIDSVLVVYLLWGLWCVVVLLWELLLWFVVWFLVLRLWLVGVLNWIAVACD